MKKTLLLALLLAPVLVSLAQEVPVPTLQSAGFEPSACPPKEALHKNHSNYWEVDADWKSDSVSFASAIASFTGAQWQGVNFGELICVYAPAGKATFPVALIHQGLVPEPNTHKWGPNMKGVRDCRSSNVADCPFMMESKKQELKNIYEELDFYWIDLACVD